MCLISFKLLKEEEEEEERERERERGERERETHLIKSLSWTSDGDFASGWKGSSNT